MTRLSNSTPTDIARREALLDKIERMTELPLMILAFAMVPLLGALLFWDLSPKWEAVTLALDLLVWALFAADLAIKIAVSPQRMSYISQHWLDVMLVLVPFARPLRVLRVIIYGARASRGAVSLIGVDYLGVYAIGLVLIVSTVVTTVESSRNSQIDSFPTALWWAMATVTTVGYGDVVPVTPVGRVFGYLLMIGGIAIYSALTANIASILVRKEDPGAAALASLAEEVRELRDSLERSGERGPPV